MPYVVVKTEVRHHWKSSTSKDTVLGYARTLFGARVLLWWEKFMTPYNPTLTWRIEQLRRTDG